jgi:hypothetical protein
VVIPTRNRPDFAERSLRSVLSGAAGIPVSIVVSDNSTDQDAYLRLEQFCRTQTPAPGVTLHHLRADDLPMSEHWEWARLRTRELTDATHVTYLTDRSAFKPDSLERLAGIAERFPDDVISYNDDLIDDAGGRTVLHQAPWTGELVAVASSRLLELSAQLIIVRPLPRMLNTLVPVTVFDRIERAYGSVFGSIAPDFCFCYRALATGPRILYYDRALFTMYGTSRSNGASMSSGQLSQDSLDFIARAAISDGVRLDESLPAASTTYAVIGGEHAAARTASPHGAVPELDRAAFLRAVARETDGFAPGQMRDVNVGALRAEGVGFGLVPRVRRRAVAAAHYLRVLGPRDFAVQAAERLTGTSTRRVSDTDAGLDWAADHDGRRRKGLATLGYLRPQRIDD